MFNAHAIRPSGCTWGKILVEEGKDKYQFPLHIPSGMIFNDDPPALIRVKCAALVFATPLISIIRAVYWLGAGLINILAETFRYLDMQSPSFDPGRVIYKNATESVRSLFFGSLMFGAALAGTALPRYGRLNYGRQEAMLNRHTKGPHRDKFYLAICFQPLSRVSDDDSDLDISAVKLIDYRRRVDAIYKAVMTGAFSQAFAQLHRKPSCGSPH